MYAVEVDLVVHFLPPMLDIGNGIRLTRTLELPFVPREDIAVFSKEWEGMEDPLGYRLKEITWDVDRNRFLAETSISMVGTPIAMIPHEIHRLTDHGWKLGSFKDQYSTERKRGRKRAKLPTMKISHWDDDEAEQWDVQPKGRPKEYKLILHTVVAMMATLQNNCIVAYAMLKTGRYADVPEGKQPRDLPPAERRFSEAVEEYLAMNFDKQWKWSERIQGRYPRLVELVEAIR